MRLSIDVVDVRGYVVVLISIVLVRYVCSCWVEEG
jgi:hypothetical protein